MTRRRFAAVMAAGALLPAITPRIALTQSSTRVPQVGLLAIGSDAHDVSARGRFVREALQERGWIDGQNVSMRVKLAHHSRERLAALAAELVQEKVDVIVTIGTDATLAARRATSGIPIVMAGAGDPIGTGLVKNLARPEGNVTGVSLLLVELADKRLQLLREVLPKLARLGVLHGDGAAALAGLRRTQALATKLGLELRPTVFRGVESVAERVAELKAAGGEALLVFSSPIIDEARATIAEAALRQRLPTMCAFSMFPDAGALMSYGVDLNGQQRRAARYVDQLLRGARPGDLPVEQPNEIELVVNARAARELGVTLPPSVLVRADRIIQ
jgi:putative ABC transport system substrate-binding protein